MFRLITSFLILITFVCIGFGQMRSDQVQEPWQNDWEKFGEAIAPYGREGYLDEIMKQPINGAQKFNRVFSKKVEWSGTLREFTSSKDTKHLQLEMQPIRVPLKDGSIIEVKELSIWCKQWESGCKGWSAELVGKEVIFRTNLVNRYRGYRPVVLLEYGGERIEIQTEGAEFVRVASH